MLRSSDKLRWPALIWGLAGLLLLLMVASCPYNISPENSSIIILGKKDGLYYGNIYIQANKKRLVSALKKNIYLRAHISNCSQRGSELPVSLFYNNILIENRNDALKVIRGQPSQDTILYGSFNNLVMNDPGKLCVKFYGGSFLTHYLTSASIKARTILPSS